MSMRTPLGRVRHHGASREGTGHFIASRFTGIALAVLAPWFVVNVALSLRGGAYVTVIDFLSRPVNAVGVILLLGVGLYHAAIGMQEIVLDYIHKPFTKVLLLALNALAAVTLAAAAVFAVLLVNFGV